MDPATREALIAQALKMREAAYAPYSRFQVGAAVLGADGRLFGGCNVENASYGLTICAERGAVVAAVAAGVRKFEAIAVATQGGASPCGACRQVLVEFADDLLVVLVDAADPTNVRDWRLRDLLPAAFVKQR